MTLKRSGERHSLENDLEMHTKPVHDYKQLLSSSLELYLITQQKCDLILNHFTVLLLVTNEGK